MSRAYVPVSCKRKHCTRKTYRVSILLLLTASLLASRPSPTPRDSFLLRVGLWIEVASRADSSTGRAWAKDLVLDLDRRLVASGLRHRARLELVQFLAPGTLPLAGGDPRHHPDLRVDTLDLVWGIKNGDDLSSSSSTILRTWLGNCGCLDDRGFVVGWDQFLLLQRPRNLLDASSFPIQGGIIHRPSWSPLPPDGGLPRSCRRALEPLRTGHGTFYSDGERRLHRTSQLLSAPLVFEVRDASGNPAAGALLELWRGRPSPTRPYATLLQGAPDSFRADSSGRIHFQSATRWLCDTLPWTHGRNGSCGTSYWRLQHAHRHASDWLDAGALLDLPDRLDTLVLRTSLPGGSTKAWQEASERWPRPWLAAETDSLGTLTLGISVPSRTEFVLRLVDEHGKETARFRSIAFEPGIYEKRLERIHARPGWDVRLDAASSRLQARIQLR